MKKNPLNEIVQHLTLISEDVESESNQDISDSKDDENNKENNKQKLSKIIKELNPKINTLNELIP